MTGHHLRDVLIVGSVPLDDAEQVFRAISTSLGERVRRIPDGETGPRLNWINSQTRVFDEHPDFQLVPDGAGEDADWRNKSADDNWKIKPWHMLRPGKRAEELEFGSLGYAEEARESYAIFSRLKQEGVIPPKCRFQVSLPTPYNVIDQRIVPEHRLDVERAYEKRMLVEVDEIAAALPHTELAIQWDTAHEIQNLDGGRPHWFENPEEGILERLVRLGNHIPADIELGYHLCYGDFMHRHFIEPKDAALMVRIANKLSKQISRSIEWIHMPVPRARTDDAYFAPLADLQLRPETRLYLGLIHYSDGVDGAQARINTASKFVGSFGVATECGFGRRKPDTVDGLLQIHVQVADRGSPS